MLGSHDELVTIIRIFALGAAVPHGLSHISYQQREQYFGALPFLGDAELPASESIARHL